MLRAGVAYEISPIKDSTRDILLPDCNRVFLGLGASYKYSEKIVVDFAYAHIFFEDTPFCIASAAANGGSTHCNPATPPPAILLRGNSDVLGRSLLGRPPVQVLSRGSLSRPTNASSTHRTFCPGTRRNESRQECAKSRRSGLRVISYLRSPVVVPSRARYACNCRALSSRLVRCRRPLLSHLAGISTLHRTPSGSEHIVHGAAELVGDEIADNGGAIS